MPKKSHEDNRLKICAPCGRKIVFGNKSVTHFRINQELEKLIQDNYKDNNFEISNPQFPLSICVSCRLALQDRQKEIKIFKRPLKVMPNYKDIISSTEIENKICNCTICLTAQYKGHSKTEVSQNYCEEASNGIETCNSIHNLKLSEDVTMMEEKKRTSKIVICGKCFQKVGKGINHCCSTSNARDNIVKMVQELSQIKQEQIASYILKSKLQNQENLVNHDENKDPKNFTDLSQNRGKKMKININLKKQKNIFFKTEALDNFQVNSGLSANNMKKLTNFIRCSAGRKSVPSFYSNHVSEKSKELDKFYNQDTFEFDTGAPVKEKRPVVWADASELLEIVLSKRNPMNNICVKVMADGGQGFFKISMSIFSQDFIDDKNENDSQSVSCHKRSLYSEGGTSAKKNKLTSVHRLLILSIVPNIKETYENIDLLFKMSSINDIPFKFVSDFKVLLIINGQQTASSSYPCPFCFIPLRWLRNSDNNNNNNDNNVLNSTHTENNTDSTDSCNNDDNDDYFRLKTYGDLKKDYLKFVAQGKNKKLAKDSNSTINPPIFVEDDNTRVIDKCVIPELHLLQGLVNHVFWTGLVPLLGEDTALLWPKKLNLVAKNYHGRLFEGNACRDLLKHADDLLHSDICKNLEMKFKLIPFVMTFHSMNRIVDCCFSSLKNYEALDKHIKELAQALKATGVSETLKIHVILNHLKQSLDTLNGSGFGVWSEQAGETIHSLFQNFWKDFKVNSIDNEIYLEKLKAATVKFSSQHL